MVEVPVCIIGCGPIGLTGALLLSRFGIKTLLLERRGALNPHPRSRFVDTNTMELMREFGLEKEVEATGLGPDWTEVNRWTRTLTGEQYAQIPSPSFHTIPRSSSPCVPVMTAQDHVESALLAKVRNDPNIDLRFHTEASKLEQREADTRLTIHDSETGAFEEVVAATRSVRTVLRPRRAPSSGARSRAIPWRSTRRTSYQEEHKATALERIAIGVEITRAMIPMMFKYTAGDDYRDACAAGGARLTSGWTMCGRSPSSTALGAGIRSWLERAWMRSRGPTSSRAWPARASPLAAQRLVATPPGSPYAEEGLVLVRPDGIIADHWRDGEVAEADRLGRLSAMLPRA